MTRHPSPAPPGPLAGADAAPDYVQRRTQEGVAILTMAGPEGNRLDPSLVAALSRAVAAAQADPGVRALVLTARGPDFCAGPWDDLPPPGPETAPTPPVLEALCALCARIEDGPKPLICALHGRVISGGLSLALAARGCVADARAVLHWPEPRRGRLPPGNAAVRLAWRSGAAPALEILHQRRPLSAERARALGLVDRVVADSLLPEAIAEATRLAAATPRAGNTGGAGDADDSGDPGDTARPCPGLQDAPAFRAAIARARAALPDPLPAHRRHEAWLLDSIEAAQLLPADQALAFDLVRAQDAAVAPPARALAYLATASRRALRLPRIAATEARGDAGAIAVSLAPALAGRILPGLLRSGATVDMLAPGHDPLAEGLEAVAEAQLKRVQAGTMSEAQSESDWDRLSGGVAPNPDRPPAIGLADDEHAAWLAERLPGGVPLAIWSTADQQARDPARSAAGWMTLIPAPVHAPRLCEVVTARDADPAALRQALRLVIGMRITPIRAIGQPLLSTLCRALGRAASRLRAAGVSVGALEATGIAPPDLAEGPVAETVEALPLPVERLLLLAVINAAAGLLESGAALRASDLDLALVLGGGWPNWRGGALAEADAIGPLVLRHELRQAAALDPVIWQPGGLFDALIRDGRRFGEIETA